MNVLTHPSRPAFARFERERPRVAIGLVNNMADAALKATERQFAGLIAEAADGFDIDFRIFTLKTTRRSERALEYIEAHYEPASALRGAQLHGLIITGAQPHADRLCGEAYWNELVGIIDWAKTHTASAILSCLAAHAAVFHLDAIERRRLSEKCTGVFPFAAARSHPLVGKRGRIRVNPHSRYNGLVERDLEAAGYAVLASSPSGGVDIFLKDFGSQFVFLQGHPEYDADSLAREYRRDMELYLRGETEIRPPRPSGYFSADREAKILDLERRAFKDRASVSLEDLSALDSLAPTGAGWRDAAVAFYRNWIAMLAAAMSRAHAPAERPAPEFAPPQYA